MAINILRFIDLLLVSLLAGTMFGIWLGFNPARLSASTYIEQQQETIRALNTLMPLLGGLCIVLTGLLAVLNKGSQRGRYLLVAAVVCLIISGAVTRFRNQPINAEVVTWNHQSPPANWMEMRDRWWKWHIVRTGAGIGALSLLISALLVELAARD